MIYSVNWKKHWEEVRAHYSEGIKRMGSEKEILANIEVVTDLMEKSYGLANSFYELNAIFFSLVVNKQFGLKTLFQ